jgi:hypothetical protein
MKTIISQKEHSVFLFICAAYFFLAVSSSNYLSESSQVLHNLVVYFLFLIPYLIKFVFVFWSIKSIFFLLQNRQEGFLGLSKCWKAMREDYLSKGSIFRFLMVIPLVPFFNFSYSSIKQTIPIFPAETFDLKFHQIDFFLHGNNIPWGLLQPIFGYPLITKTIDFLYLRWCSFFLFTLLWMALSKRRYLRMQFFLSLISCWIIIGNLLARLLASAGPCYFGKVVDSAPDPYVSMMAYLRSIPGLWAVGIQDTLWQSHINGIFMPLGGISAMPSMHVSIAVLLALVFSRVNFFLGAFFSLFALIIQIGSVHLGWHYAIDGYVSTIMTILIWFLVQKSIAFFQRQGAAGKFRSEEGPEAIPSIPPGSKI